MAAQPVLNFFSSFFLIVCCLLYVDRLLDLGFEKDLNAIIQALDKAKTDVRRQSVLLSATLSSGKSEQTPLPDPGASDSADAQIWAPQVWVCSCYAVL